MRRTAIRRCANNRPLNVGGGLESRPLHSYLIKEVIFMSDYTVDFKVDIERAKKISNSVATEIRKYSTTKPVRDKYKDYKTWQQANTSWWNEVLPVLHQNRLMFSVTRLAKLVGVSRWQLYRRWKQAGYEI